MKIILFSAVLLAASLTSSRAAEVTITGFGSADENPFNLSTDPEGLWQGKGTLTSTAVDFAGVSNESGNGIIANFQKDGDSPVEVGTNTAYMLLTATLNSTTPGVDEFSISLFDAGGDELDYTFAWSSFASGGTNGTTVIADLSGQSGGTFDGTVVGYELNLFDTTNTTPTTLSVNFFDMGVEDSADIPEPSSWALLLLAVGGIALARQLARKFQAVRL